ncbi:MAG: TerB family tellurite resistance protein [Vicinamibacteria bacterium]
MDERSRAELVREIRELLEDSLVRRAGESLAARRVRLAAALLMVCVVRADHEDRHDEHLALERAVARALGVGGHDAPDLVRAAEEAMGQGLAFAAVVDRVDRGCSVAEKRRVVEELWRIAFSDAELAAQEEYLVRKVADRFGLTTADLVETKVKAREAFLSEDL